MLTLGGAINLVPLTLTIRRHFLPERKVQRRRLLVFPRNTGEVPGSKDCSLLNAIRPSRIARGAEAGALPEFWQWNRC